MPSPSQFGEFLINTFINHLMRLISERLLIVEVHFNLILVYYFIDKPQQIIFGYFIDKQVFTTLR